MSGPGSSKGCEKSSRKRKLQVGDCLSSPSNSDTAPFLNEQPCQISPEHYDILCNQVFGNSTIFLHILKLFTPSDWLRLELVCKNWQQGVLAAFRQLHSLNMVDFVVGSHANELPSGQCDHLFMQTNEMCHHERNGLCLDCASMRPHREPKARRYEKLIRWTSTRCPNLKNLTGIRFIPGYHEDIVVSDLGFTFDSLYAFQGLKGLHSLEMGCLDIPYISFSGYLSQVAPNLRKLLLRGVWGMGDDVENMKRAFSNMYNLEILDLCYSEFCESPIFLWSLPADRDVTLKSFGFGFCDVDWNLVAGFLEHFGQGIEELELVDDIDGFGMSEVKYLFRVLGTLSKKLKKLTIRGEEWVEIINEDGNGHAVALKDEVIEALSSLQSLEEFTIDSRFNSYLIKEALRTVCRNCPNIRKITAGNSYLFRDSSLYSLRSEDVVRELNHLENLEEVTYKFNRCIWMSEDLKTFATLTKLRHLTLEILPPEPFDFSFLKHMEGLESLKIGGRPLSPGFHFGNCLPTTVRSLSLGFLSTEFVWTVLRKVGEQLTTLELLRHNLRMLGSPALIAKFCPNLEVFQLADAIGAHFPRQGPFSQCPSLHSLAEKMTLLAELCPKVKTLVVTHQLKMLMLRNGFYREGVVLKGKKISRDFPGVVNS